MSKKYLKITVDRCLIEEKEFLLLGFYTEKNYPKSGVTILYIIIHNQQFVKKTKKKKKKKKTKAIWTVLEVIATSMAYIIILCIGISWIVISIWILFRSSITHLLTYFSGCFVCHFVSICVCLLVAIFVLVQFLTPHSVKKKKQHNKCELADQLAERGNEKPLARKIKRNWIYLEIPRPLPTTTKHSRTWPESIT